MLVDPYSFTHSYTDGLPYEVLAYSSGNSTFNPKHPTTFLCSATHTHTDDQEQFGTQYLP